MKTFLNSLFGLILISLSCTPADDSVQTVIHQVNVVQMDREAILENQSVIIKDNKISAIIPSSDFKAGKNTTVIDGKGKYIMPGLSEFHSHIPNAQNGNFEFAQDVMWMYVMHGVLTVRGMIGHPSHLELISKIKSGEIVGPRIFPAGPSLNGNSVSDPESGAQMVREQKEAGYVHLKLHPGLDKPRFDAIAQAAKEVGIYYGGHVSADVGLVHSLNGGYRSVEHMDGYIEALVEDPQWLAPEKAGPFGLYLSPHINRERMDELVALSKQTGAWIVPTQSLFERWFGPQPLSAYQNDEEFKLVPVNMRGGWFNQRRMLDNSNPDYALVNEYLAFRREMIKKLYDAGVPFVLGSDSPQVFNVPGASAIHEMTSLINCGLSPFQVYQTGTINAAKYFNQETIFGQVKEGFDADLVLLDANPLLDVNNFKQINGVFVQGKFYDRALLDQKRMELIEKFKE